MATVLSTQTLKVELLMYDNPETNIIHFEIYHVTFNIFSHQLSEFEYLVFCSVEGAQCG